MRFGRSDDLAGAEFLGTDLRGARFLEADLSGAVLRGVEVAGVEVDSPWLPEGPFVVNGVDVVGFVEAELDRRFPGRGLRRAADPAGLREAWAAVERTWADTVERVAAMPAGTDAVSVAGEWTFAETLRHLVLATDLWLGRAILESERPLHPLGLLYTGAEADGHDLSVFTRDEPAYDEVLRVRAARMTMVRELVAGLTPELLAESRRNPHSGEQSETVLSCLHTILAEEWEHHRFAARDLDAIAAGAGQLRSSTARA